MGFADPEALVEGQINSRGDCFNDIEPIAFGIRVQAMILKDVDCADIRYQQMCQDTIYENRIIWEEDCSSTGCVMPEDDPFMACLGCDPVDDYHIDSKHDRNIDRQAGEVFQATGQS